MTQLAASKAPTFHPKSVCPRTTQLGVAHDLARKLGLETRLGHDRSAYEARLFDLIGKRSLKGATRDERGTVIRAFEDELETRQAGRRAWQYVSDDEALEVLG